jgi:hypothetical protein
MKPHPGILSLAFVFSCAIGLHAEEPRVDFARQIRPILSDNCFQCHGPDEKERKAKLRLDVREGVLGANPGQGVVVAGKVDESELFQRLIAEEPTRRMPPAKSKRTLTSEQIDLVRRWIEQGADWKQHWAFEAPVRPPLPQVRDGSWCRDPLDRFILARLEREGLEPSPEAGRGTLLRRVTLDLTGLPPSPEEVDAFLADESPDAYEKAVDRLLASPRFGERVVLEWLDAARYADTNGYQQDRTRTLWPWRDWAVRALNDNMPFDQFTLEQIAGDLLPGATLEQKVATGFHRNHMLNGEGGRIAEESRVDYCVDRVDTTATVWLGLTVGCARCHDHKFDPFSQKEYYQLLAYFNSIDEVGGVDRGGNAAPVLAIPAPGQQDRMDDLNKSIAELEKKLKEKLPEKEVDSLKKKLDQQKKAVEAARKSVVETMVMQDRPQPRETFVLLRGVYTNRGEKVEHGVPAVLHGLPEKPKNNRLDLARWLVDRRNPLTARVAVNHAWLRFFGTGIVRTVEDFGVQGEPPSHPELLDWLAVEFMESGWDVKALYRRIVTSATYRQSSRVTPLLRERDPQNRLLARGPRYRLPSMVLRDQALAVSGLLVEQVGGPPVKPYQPPGIWEEMSFGKTKYVQDHGRSLYRRSLYTFWRRAVGPTSFFDMSARQICTVRQGQTNTPLHALTTFNDVTHVEAARMLAERVMKAKADPQERLTYLFRLATSRRPTDKELAILLQSFERLRKVYQQDPESAKKLLSVGEHPRDQALDQADHAALAGVANLVLNLDEVLFKE